MSAARIARLRITLDDVKPAVLRCIEVPLTLRLDRLHLAIQSAMGWTNSHLYEIRAGDVGWGMTDQDWGDGPLDARKARLIDVLEDVGTKTETLVSKPCYAAPSTRVNCGAHRMVTDQTT